MKNRRAERDLKESHAGYLDKGIAPRVNACRQPGEWQSLDAIFPAPRFQDGKKITNAEQLVSSGTKYPVRRQRADRDLTGY